MSSIISCNSVRPLVFVTVSFLRIFLSTTAIFPDTEEKSIGATALDNSEVAAKDPKDPNDLASPAIIPIPTTTAFWGLAQRCDGDRQFLESTPADQNPLCEKGFLRN